MVNYFSNSTHNVLSAVQTQRKDEELTLYKWAYTCEMDHNSQAVKNTLL